MKSGAYAISVIVDEQPLEEHQVETEGEKTSCWIASEEGKSFKMKVEQTKNWSENDSCFRVYLDGAKLSDGFLLSKDSLSRKLDGKSISNDEIAPYIFQVVTTTDEATIESAQDLNDSFGSIEVRVHRGTKGGISTSSAGIVFAALTSTFNELAIKEKKVTHVCALGAPVQIKNTRSKFEYLDPIGLPFLVFTFKYQSKTLLQAMGIIKSSASSPAPLRSRVNQLREEGDTSIIVISSDEEDEDTTDDEELEAAKKIREMEAALAEAKKAAEAKKSIKKKVVVKTEIEDVKPNIQHLEKIAPRARAQPSRKVKKEIE